MKQLVIKCYTWDELSEDQKKRICEKNRDIGLDMLTTEDIIWDFSNAGQLIADSGFLNPEVYFNHSYSQGDGACFDCTDFNWDLLLEDLEIPHKSLFKKLLNDSSDLESRIYRPNVPYAHHYTYARCRQFEIILYNTHEVPRVNKIIYKIMLHVEQKRFDLCHAAFREIVNAIEATRSDEHLYEFFATMNCYYREDTLQSIDECELQEIKEEE